MAQIADIRGKTDKNAPKSVEIGLNLLRYIRFICIRQCHNGMKIGTTSMSTWSPKSHWSGWTVNFINPYLYHGLVDYRGCIESGVV